MLEAWFDGLQTFCRVSWQFPLLFLSLAILPDPRLQLILNLVLGQRRSR